jgi:hypothetical protein
VKNQKQSTSGTVSVGFGTNCWPNNECTQHALQFRPTVLNGQNDKKSKINGCFLEVQLVKSNLTGYILDETFTF